MMKIIEHDIVILLLLKLLVKKFWRIFGFGGQSITFFQKVRMAELFCSYDIYGPIIKRDTY